MGEAEDGQPDAIAPAKFLQLIDHFTDITATPNHDRTIYLRLNAVSILSWLGV